MSSEIGESIRSELKKIEWEKIKTYALIFFMFVSLTLGAAVYLSIRIGMSRSAEAKTVIKNLELQYVDAEKKSKKNLAEINSLMERVRKTDDSIKKMEADRIGIWSNMAGKSWSTIARDYSTENRNP